MQSHSVDEGRESVAPRPTRADHPSFVPYETPQRSQILPGKSLAKGLAKDQLKDLAKGLAEGLADCARAS